MANNNVFDMPTLDLARTTATSRAESRQYALAHGDTDEMMLERRRIAASSRLRVIEAAIESMELAKKTVLLRLDQKIALLQKRNSPHGSREDDIAEAEEQKKIERGTYDER